MAWANVTSYYLRYNTEIQHKKQERCVVGIHYQGGDLPDGEDQVRHFTVPADEALFLADMLRNEKPVLFDPDTGGIATRKEEVGEGEISQEDGG